MRWVHRIFAVLTLGPVVLWLLAIGTIILLGVAGGCRIDEGSVHPCRVLGLEVGEAAYTIGILAAWGPLLIGPICLLAGLLWVTITLIARMRGRR